MMIKYLLLASFCGVALSMPALDTPEKRIQVALQAGAQYPPVKAQMDLVSFLCQDAGSDKIYECMECYMMTGDSYELLGMKNNTFPAMQDQYKKCFSTYPRPVSIEPCIGAFNGTHKEVVDVTERFNAQCETTLTAAAPRLYNNPLVFPIEYETLVKPSITETQALVLSLRLCLLVEMMPNEAASEERKKNQTEWDTLADEGCQRMTDSGIYLSYALAREGEDYQKVDPKTYDPSQKA